MKITFIQTGGTIDKDYPRTKKGYAFEITTPAIKRILENLNPSFSFKILTAFRKDSTEITLSDRAKLLAVCMKTRSNKIVITHGTDTMIETAKYLSSSLKNKTIVITGAMRPERFSNSDASFNTGFAVAAVQTLPVGVYIAMHGNVFLWNRCKRNNEGQFILK
jgi:L-asparaginase